MDWWTGTQHMIRSIRDLVLSIFMLGWEILIIIMAITRYDHALGLFKQPLDYYVLITALCIFSVAFDVHIKESQKRMDAL